MIRRADRSHRVLLVSSRVKDRSFMRPTGPETAEFFDSLRVTGGEKAFLQHYAGPETGWQTIRVKAKTEAA